MSGNTDHATNTRSLFTDKEAGIVCVDREHPLASVVQSIFPHACLGLENDDSDPMMEKDESLALSLAFMVPAQGKETQLTRAIMQSGGMRKFSIPMERINSVMQAVCEAIPDHVSDIKTYDGLRDAVISEWSRLQGDRRVRLDPSDIIPDSPPAPEGAQGGSAGRRASPRAPPPRPRRTRRTAGSGDEGAGDENGGGEDGDSETAAATAGSTPPSDEPETFVDGFIRLEDMLVTSREAEDVVLPLEALSMLRLSLAHSLLGDDSPPPLL